VSRTSSPGATSPCPLKSPDSHEFAERSANIALAAEYVPGVKPENVEPLPDGSLRVIGPDGSATIIPAEIAEQRRREWTTPEKLASAGEWLDARVRGLPMGRDVRDDGSLGDWTVAKTRGRRPSAPASRSRAHSPREARGPRRRGAGRPAAARRASTSRDDGSDGDEPEPPADGRLCQAPWCEHIVYGAPQKRYCGTERCNRARDEERQRKHRAGDLTALERQQLDDARRAGYVGDEAFAGPYVDDQLSTGHALSFLWRFALVPGTDPGEYEALLHRSRVAVVKAIQNASAARRTDAARARRPRSARLG
jgi:hypothetical protein